MDPAQAVHDVVETRGVHYVTLNRVAALARLGLLPELPTDLRNLNLHGRTQDPARADLIPLEWALAGSDCQPSAVIAVRSKFDYGYGTNVLEVVHIAGSRIGVGRLIKWAQKIADLYTLPLTGEVDIQNRTMAGLLHKIGARPERVRWTLAPKALEQ